MRLSALRLLQIAGFSTRFLFTASVSFAALAFVPAGRVQNAPAQQSSHTEEIVANLSAGRVIIAVVKDAILLATIENPIETGTHPPTPVQLGSTRAGILLGPIDWFSPSSQKELARLNEELPRLRSVQLADAPHLQAGQGGGEATDIEVTGQGLFERYDTLASALQGKLELPATEPFAELIIADYLGGYGPEVWQLTYQVKQVEEQRDYWQTRVLHPSYSQIWPPEKGQPRTLVEFNYPTENPPASLAELMQQKDSRLAKITASDSHMADVMKLFLQGESGKVTAVDGIQFLRAIITAMAPPQSRQTMAEIKPESGFRWIIAPPPEPRTRLPVSAGQSPQQDRAADAPSLLNPHPSR